MMKRMRPRDRKQHAPRNMNTELRNMWKGQDVWIVAGGPSIKLEWFPQLEGRKVIAVNWSLRDVRADMLCFVDSDVSTPAMEKSRESGSMIVAGHTSGVTPDRSKGWYVVTSLHARDARPNVEPDLTRGAVARTSSTALAIQTARYMGCRRIYVMGLDANFRSGKGHYYSGERPHDGDGDENRYKRVAKLYNSLAFDNVYNLSPQSSVTAYRKMTFEESLVGRIPGIPVIIPARGASKRIKRKNLQKVGGKTLVQIAVEHGFQLSTDVYVSTEDAEIRKEARDAGARIIDRPQNLASDKTNVIDVMRHARDHVSADRYILLQPTSPGRDIERIKSELDEAKKRRSAMTAYPFRKFMWQRIRDGLAPINRRWDARPRTQDMGHFIIEDGAFYMIASEMLDQKDFISKDCHIIEHRQCVDIDTPQDLEAARMEMGT